MTTCSDCENDLSSEADDCPHCGRPSEEAKAPPAHRSRTRTLLSILALLVLIGSVGAESETSAGPSSQPGQKLRQASHDPSSSTTLYASASALNVRLAPRADGELTNRIYRQSSVQVYEHRDGWARISKYYDGDVEGLSGQVARWVSASYLSKKRPADLPQPKLKSDPRIEGLPHVGMFGLTEKDVTILHRAANSAPSLVGDIANPVDITPRKN